jgi:hypothetical protein
MTPEFTIKKIRGDWTTRGVIDNLNRRRELKVAIVNGVAMPTDITGTRPEPDCVPLRRYSDGEIHPGGAGVGFLPDDGEIERIGNPAFDDQ